MVIVPAPGDQQFGGRRVTNRLGRGEQPRAEGDTGRAEHQCGGEAATVGDPAGGHDRQRGHGIDDGGNEPDRAPPGAAVAA